MYMPSLSVNKVGRSFFRSTADDVADDQKSCVTCRSVRRSLPVAVHMRWTELTLAGGRRRACWDAHSVGRVVLNHLGDLV